MTLKEKVSTLLFDFGNVFIDIDFQKTTDQLSAIGIEVEDVKSALFDSTSPFRLFQTGKLSRAEFRDSLRKLSIQHLDDATIDSVWCAMIGGVAPAMVELLTELQGKYRLVLFSNTDDIHADFFEQAFYDSYQFPISSLFDHVFYSQRIGIAKPDLEAFEYIIDALEVSADSILFLDDIAENVDAAKQVGINAVQVIDHCNPRPILESLGFLAK